MNEKPENNNLDPVSDEIIRAKRERYRSRDFGEGYDTRYRGGINSLNTAVEREWIARHAEPGDLLDAGAGTGRFSSFLSGRGHRVVTLDSSAGMLAELRNRSPEVETLLGDIYELPFSTARFDTVVCMHVLFHLPDWDRVVAGLAALLKPGGRIFFEMRSGEHVAAFAGLADRLGLRGSMEDGKDPSDTTFHATIERVREVLSRCGVRLESTLRYDLPHSYWFRPLNSAAEFLLRRSSPLVRLCAGIELALGRVIPPSAAYRTLYMGCRQ